MNFPTTLFMAKRLIFRLLLAVLLLPAGLLTLQAQDNEAVFPKKPEPAVYVHDYAGWLAPGDKMALEQRLRRYFDSTSTQIVVMIRPDLGEYDKAMYAVELGRRWGVGQKDKNNGIIMLIKSQPPDRGIYIATGYGTEGAIPDILAARIIRNTMAPYFKNQQYADGINAGITDITRALGGEFKADPKDQAGDATAGFVILMVFLGLVFIIIFAIWRARKNGKLYRNDDRNNHDDNWPRGGGWIIGGSPWIGGGGGWSSGGSSGGSDWGSGGDFGGGSFGGGGAGGDW